MTPIFLIGAGRSGTKYLRSLLGGSEDISTIPYDVGYVWRYGNESFESDELSIEQLSPKIEKYIKNALPQLVDKSSHKSAKYYVEKSVPNSLRVQFIHKIFPDAKFIFLVRDGRAVTESSIRLWQEPSDKGYLLKKLKYFPWRNYRYAIWYVANMIKGKVNGRGQMIWGPRYSGIDTDVQNLPLETVCARQWRKCVEIANNDLASIPKEQVIKIRYEDFMSSNVELQRICDFLDISDSKNVISLFVDTFEPSNLDKWKVSLSKSQIDVIQKEIGKTLQQFNY